MDDKTITNPNVIFRRLRMWDKVKIKLRLIPSKNEWALCEILVEPKFVHEGVISEILPGTVATFKMVLSWSAG